MENNKLITFEYFNNEYLSEVTMIQDDEKNVWFKGVDIARILGYSNTREALKRHVEEDDKIKLNKITGSQNTTPLNSQPHSVFINESGIYSLILRSKLDEAKLFKNGLQRKFSQVLENPGPIQ